MDSDYEHMKTTLACVVKSLGDVSKVTKQQNECISILNDTIRNLTARIEWLEAKP